MQIEKQNSGSIRESFLEDSEKTYHLKCEVKRKVITGVNNETKYEMTIVYLVPQMSGEMIKFYDAYLPANVIEVDNNELVFLNLTTGNVFRGFLSPPTKEINERHIFIMTESEKDLINRAYKFNFFTSSYMLIDCIPFSEQVNYNV